MTKTISLVDEIIRSMYARTAARTATLVSTLDDLNVPGEKGQHLLHEAIYVEDSDTVKLLLEYGANPNLPSKDGMPLFLACKLNNLEITALLISKNAESESTGPSGTSALMEALHHQNQKLMKLLLEKGAKPDFKPASGDSPLVQAISDGNLAIIKLLHRYVKTAQSL